jgi:hypothetical protein
MGIFHFGHFWEAYRFSLEENFFIRIAGDEDSYVELVIRQRFDNGVIRYDWYRKWGRVTPTVHGRLTGGIDGIGFSPACAGINRHGVADERAVQERSSEPS